MFDKAEVSEKNNFDENVDDSDENSCCQYKAVPAAAGTRHARSPVTERCQKKKPQVMPHFTSV